MIARSSAALVFIVVLGFFLASIGNIPHVESGETIHIGADGSVEGTDKIQRDGDLYIFLADISNSIVVERDNIVIDGSGHVVQGPGSQVPDSIGIYLNGTTRVTLKSMRIEMFFIGVWLDYSSNNKIVGNVLVDNKNSIFFFESSDNIIRGNEILNTRRIFTAIWFQRSSYNNISENKIAGNSNGITIHESSNNTIAANNMTDNSRALSEYDCAGSTIYQNYMANNDRGLVLTSCSSNLIFDNCIKSSNDGIQLYNSSGNRMFHNRLTNNTIQAYTEYSFNVWHDAYPSGGNYWSDYNGTDENCGPYQNQTGKDGIGDTSYRIDGNNVDVYPLINPFAAFPLKTDLNRDGRVNILDITLVSHAFGSTPENRRWDPRCDLDNNGIVDIIDLTVVARNFGKTA